MRLVKQAISARELALHAEALGRLAEGQIHTVMRLLASINIGPETNLMLLNGHLCSINGGRVVLIELRRRVQEVIHVLKFDVSAVHWVLEVLLVAVDHDALGELVVLELLNRSKVLERA